MDGFQESGRPVTPISIPLTCSGHLDRSMNIHDTTACRTGSCYSFELPAIVNKVRTVGFRIARALGTKEKSGGKGGNQFVVSTVSSRAALSFPNFVRSQKARFRRQTSGSVSQTWYSKLNV